MPKTCCICGKMTDNDNGILLTGGRIGSVCRECDALLNEIDAENPDKTGAENAYRELQVKMQESKASLVVFDAVESVYKNPEGSPVPDASANRARTDVYPSGGAKGSTGTDSKTPAGGTTRGFALIKLAGNVDAFMLIFTIIEVIICIGIGISVPYFGWMIGVGGSLLAIMAYVFVHMILRVFEEIGRISDNTQETNRHLAELVRQMTGKKKG